MTETVKQGNAVRSRAVFRDIEGELLDPAAVFHRLRTPDLTESDYEYGVDAEVIRESEGMYLFWIATASAPEDYTTRWVGYDIAGNEIANETTFTAEASVFSAPDPTP